MSNKDYRVRQLLEMEACTNCRICADVCPAVLASREGTLSAAYRVKGLKEILKGRVGFLKKFFKRNEVAGDRLREFSDTVFRCTLCGNCQEVCPVGIHLKDLWLSLRMDMGHSEAYPKKIDMIRENLIESHNVFAEDNEERADWVEDMDSAREDGYIKDKSEVVYFTGCVASYFPMAQKIPIALAEIFDAADVDFSLMGEDEWCCGFPLLGAGLGEIVQGFVDHNVDAVNEKGATEVVFACPSCYQMWLEHYPPQFKLYHSTQFLRRLVEESVISLKPLPMKVTYHDPCDLGRGAREFDAPRDILRAIPGLRFVELPESREQCQCCGGGGNLEMMDAALAAEIGRNKIEQVLSTGAEAVVTSCQQCVRSMMAYVRKNKVDLEVLDITQLLHRAMDRPETEED